MAWDHQAVFKGLVDRGTMPIKTKGKCYIQLYPQKHNCAILYSPGTAQFRSSPLHLHPGRKDSWKPEFYSEILPAIDSVQLESKSKSQSKQNFLLCKID
jgi:hypothetical protein